MWIMQDPILQRKQTYLQQSGVQIVPQSPYSPDLDLWDRFLFTRLQQHCWTKEYSNGEELYIDAKQCINLTFKLAHISCSEHE